MARKKDTNLSKDVYIHDKNKIKYEKDDDEDTKGKKLFNLVFVIVSIIFCITILFIYIVRYLNAHEKQKTLLPYEEVYKI